jgi:hypothetical protein
MNKRRLNRNADYLAEQDRLRLDKHTCYGKDSPAAPPPPDYTGAAQATAAGNIDAARSATKANRVNTYTPYGSQTYAQIDPSDPDSAWRSDITLSPEGRQLLDFQNTASINLGNETGRALDRVNSGLSQPFDLGSPDAAVNKAYGNITSRLNPQWDTSMKALENKLANQGIVQGSEAYTNAMRDFNFAKNDAYTQANTQAMNFAPQTLQMALTGRNQPLNELNALRTGSQVTNPTFSQAPQQGQTAGPNYSAAAGQQGGYDQNIYAQQVGGNNAMTSGLFSLGGAALGVPGVQKFFGF